MTYKIGDENQESEDEHREKRVAYYSAVVTGWINTKLERDKSLLTISSAGIAAVVALYASKGINSTVEAYLLVTSLISFIFAIVIIIRIFDRNGEIFKAAAHGEKPVSLKKLDVAASSFFLIGIVTAILVVLTHAYVGSQKAINESSKCKCAIQKATSSASISKDATKVKPTAPVLLPLTSGHASIKNK